MSNLLESILSEDYVSASTIFESRLNEIREKKLVEMKKCIQAEAAGGGLTAAQMQARKEMGWKRASDVLGDPRDEPLPSITPKQKSPVKKRKKLKEDISRSDVEAEKEKLKKSPGYKQIQARRKATPSPEHMPAVDQRATDKMSPELRRSQLEKSRQEKIKGLMDKGKYKSAGRLMTFAQRRKIDRSDLAKSMGSFAKGIAGALAGNSPI